MPRPLLLASSSPYRQGLLARLQLPFEARSPDLDERRLPEEPVLEMSIRLASAKAAALRTAYPQHIIIGSDQAAELDGQPLGKPGSQAAARVQLQRMSGRTVVFHTAVCVLDAASGRSVVMEVPTRVVFRTLGSDRVEHYLQREPAFDCAGSFKSEALGISLCREITSSDPTALIGLPLIALVEMLEAFGIEVPLRA